MWHFSTSRAKGYKVTRVAFFHIEGEGIQGNPCGIFHIEDEGIQGTPCGIFPHRGRRDTRHPMWHFPASRTKGYKVPHVAFCDILTAPTNQHYLVVVFCHILMTTSQPRSGNVVFSHIGDEGVRGDECGKMRHQPARSQNLYRYKLMLTRIRYTVIFFTQISRNG